MFYVVSIDLPEVIAGLQVDCDGGIREVLEVDRQDLLGHVIVVQLVVAEGHVDVEGEILAIVKQYSLVDINSFLIVRSDNNTNYFTEIYSYPDLR